MSERTVPVAIHKDQKFPARPLRDVTEAEVLMKPILWFDLDDFTEPARSNITSMIGGGEDVVILAQVTKEPKP